MAKTKAEDELEVAEEVGPEIVEFKGESYDLTNYNEVRLGQKEGREAGKAWCWLIKDNNTNDSERVDIPVSNIDEARQFQYLCHLQPLFSERARAL